MLMYCKNCESDSNDFKHRELFTVHQITSNGVSTNSSSGSSNSSSSCRLAVVVVIVVAVVE